MVFIVTGNAVFADSVPPPPHSPTSSDGIDAPGFVRVQSTAHGGTGGFIDVPGYRACRFVTIDDPTIGGEAILVNSLANWNSWRRNRPTTWQTVCCRPQTVTLCASATGGPQQATVTGIGAGGYGKLGESGTATAHCSNAPNLDYDETQSFTCGQSGTGVDADGAWTGGSQPSDICDAQNNTCSGNCGGGQGVDKCGFPCTNNQSCCQSNYIYSCTSCSADCGGGTQSCYYHDYNNCGGSDYGQISQNCNTQVCQSPPPPPPAVTTTYYAACVPQWCGPGTPGTGFACDCNYWYGGVSGQAPQTGDGVRIVGIYTTLSDADPWYWNTTGNPGPGNGAVTLPQPCSGGGCSSRPPYENNPKCTLTITGGIYQNTTTPCQTFGPECAPTAATYNNAEIARFYGSTFGRIPDLPGYEAWSLAVANGVVTLQQAAQGFLTSGEFTQRYGAVGTLSDGQFVTDMYGNVLGRAPDQGGLIAWTSQLATLEAQNGNTADGILAARAAILQGFATSTEEIQHTSSWLIDPKSGGYADGATPINAQTVLNQGEANNYVNTALMPAPAAGTDIHSANAVMASLGGIVSGWELDASTSGSPLLYSAQVNNATALASAAVPNVIINGNNATIFGGPTSGTIGTGGINGTMIIGSGATHLQGPSLAPVATNAPTSCGETVINFNPAKDIYIPVVTARNGVTILDASQGQVFDGANLQFDPLYGTTAKIPTPMLKLGDVGGGSAAEVAAAINKVYTLADTAAEHLIIVGQVTLNSALASAGDTVMYEYLQFAGVGFSLAKADLNQNHLVDANELTYEAKFVGLPTGSITAHSFSG